MKFGLVPTNLIDLIAMVSGLMPTPVGLCNG